MSFAFSSPPTSSVQASGEELPPSAAALPPPLFAVAAGMLQTTSAPVVSLPDSSSSTTSDEQIVGQCASVDSTHTNGDQPKDVVEPARQLCQRILTCVNAQGFCKFLRICCAANVDPTKGFYFSAALPAIPELCSLMSMEPLPTDSQLMHDAIR
eukprot:317378-Hanusia_phi.AAC.1